ncbi:hypothetical protein BBAL3_1006 [Brevundimonas sp. BAL3]|uniref:phage tail tube protein n=1 Tax=Brevundimonas sp. BAL3 TaxID=391600 RepID=UPI00017EBAD5|nr:phage tail tube protein [Brevundimonas sp. BAL3]EDX79849.1 hypothetical protein BBAL3_1006 [Brevundimonas sp. BAL3]
MARARGANVSMALAFESTYGVPPASGYTKFPIVTEALGEEQGLIESDLLGYGREPQAPSQDVINNEGDVVVPLDLRNFGLWLKALMGAPTSTQGVAATGSYTFSAQPTANAILTVGGQAFTFVTTTPTANQIKIGANLAETVANAVIALNASAVAGVAVASYAANLAGTQILITYDVVGTAGNAMTIVAGTSPATNATVSGATLTGGAATGPYNHVFQSGALVLPTFSAEVGMPEVPSYAMNFGAAANTIAIPLQRSGNLNATIGVIAQGETRAGATAAGTPATLAIERFSQFSGQIERDGVPLGDLVSGRFNYSNNMDKVEVIRSDGRIAGVDPGMVAVSGEIVVRFANTTLMDLAAAGTPVDLVHRWSIGAGKTLVIRVPKVSLPKPKVPVAGPAGVQATFAWQASQHATLGKTCIITLVNDQTTY